MRDSADSAAGPLAEPSPLDASSAKEKARTARFGLKPPFEEVEETVRMLAALLVRCNKNLPLNVSENTHWCGESHPA
jgi:hypothetical protein